MSTLEAENPLRADPSVIVPLTVRLERGDTELPACSEIPLLEYGEGSYYHAPPEPLSIAQLPSSGAEYEYACSTVVRQNARAATRRGYEYLRIDRAEWEDDLHALRSSTDFRQGRAMPRAYLERQSYSSDRWPELHCKRHLATVHGVIATDGHLAAYAQMVQCGEIARVNTILGHAELLRDGIVWLLLLEAIRWHIDASGARYALYYAHASGHGGGLRYWKERFGFRPADVTWA